MNLVIGSTGMVGGEVCRLLAAEGKPVRALVREVSDQAKVDALKELGAEIVIGDLRDRASLDAACKGATALIVTASSMPFSYQPGENDIQTVDTDGMISLVDAAKAAGVGHFIYTSFTMDNNFPLRNAKRAVEQHLLQSGLTYTILRPSYFFQVWLSPAVGFDAANAKAQVYGTGETPLSLIDFQDVARFAVKCLETPEAKNAILDLGGPQMLTQHELVSIFEAVSGKSFEVQHVPAEALAEQQKGATDPMQQSFLGLMRWYAQGDPVDMEKTLKAFPLQLKSVKEYAKGMFS